MAKVQVRVISTYEVEIEAEYGDTDEALRDRAYQAAKARLAYPDAVTAVKR